MINKYAEYLRNIPLLLGGLFLIYVGVADQMIFYEILDNTYSDRLGITLATTVSAGVPIFFAVGLIKKGVFLRWETIHFYEKMLEGKSFWVLTIAFLLILAYFAFNKGLTLLSNSLILVACVSLIIYLIFYIKKK
jgi:hypothetical protein